MYGLVDLRVLVLLGTVAQAAIQRDLDLLRQRTTSHVLPVTLRTLPVTMLRVIKRLAFGQDDLLVLYGLPFLMQLAIAALARLWGRPVLAIAISPGRQQTNQVAGRALGLAVIPAGSPDRLLRAIAQRTRRPWPAAGRRPLRLDVGCGSEIRPGFVGIDARQTRATALVADARALAVQDHIADEVYASCLLEHFDDPHQVLREIHRVLRAEGQAVLRLPNLGTYSSHLDTTHRFLADLALWRRILVGYFADVQVVPVGTKYRDNSWLVRVNWVLVHVFKWYELAQGWDFICRQPRRVPTVEYTGWWEE